MAWFYEIRSSTNTVLKRDGGFPTQDAAKIAGREDAKKMKNMAGWPSLSRPCIILLRVLILLPYVHSELRFSP